MKGNCGECERRYFCEIDPDKCNEWPDPVPQTNADRIRAMSDEELANWLDYMYGRCDWCDTNKVGTDDCSDIACTDCIFEWLKQPAEVDNGR